jgi:mono/diheme cytochrome c family protein
MKLIIGTIALLVMLTGPIMAGDTSVTYAEQVAPILQQHCQVCHRPGHVAPFSLLNYEHAKKRARLIAEVAGGREMPPLESLDLGRGAVPQPERPERVGDQHLTPVGGGRGAGG